MPEKFSRSYMLACHLVEARMLASRGCQDIFQGEHENVGNEYLTLAFHHARAALAIIDKMLASAARHCPEDCVSLHSFTTDYRYRPEESAIRMGLKMRPRRRPGHEGGVR